MIDIAIINKIAKAAGDKILLHYNTDVNVDQKDDSSPITMADLDGHNEIMKGLKEYYPDIPVISEEAVLPDYNIRKKWVRFFLVDPLDGTKEFIKMNGEFTVNIALIENEVPTLGVVYIPVEDVLYFATQESGSFRQSGNNSPVRIGHDAYEKGSPARIMVSRSHRGNDTQEKLAKLGIEVTEEIPSGSSLKFCRVAEGVADLYPRFGPTMEWDTAAADAIFRYSGKNGNRASPLKYNKEDLHNPEFIIGLD